MILPLNWQRCIFFDEATQALGQIFLFPLRFVVGGQRDFLDVGDGAASKRLAVPGNNATVCVLWRDSEISGGTNAV